MLVEGDDLSEPVSDAMRGILDGHLWLARDLANRGHYPAIDILESISRVMPEVVDEQHQQSAQKIKHCTAVFRDIEDLVNIGAYAMGTNPEFDLAVNSRAEIERFLRQGMHEEVSFDQAQRELKELANQINNAGVNKIPLPQQQGKTKDNQAQAQRNSLQSERMMAGV